MSDQSPKPSLATSSSALPKVQTRKSVEFNNVASPKVKNTTSTQGGDQLPSFKKRGHARSRSFNGASSKEQRMEEAKSQMDQFLTRASGFRKLRLTSVLEAAIQTNVIPSPRSSESSSDEASSDSSSTSSRTSLTVPFLSVSSTSKQLAPPPNSPRGPANNSVPSKSLSSLNLNFTPSQLTLLLQGEPVLLRVSLFHHIHNNNNNQLINKNSQEKFFIMVTAGNTLFEISKLIKQQIPSLWRVSHFNLILEGQKWNSEKQGDLKLLSLPEVRAKYTNEEEIQVQVEVLDEIQHSPNAPATAASPPTTTNATGTSTSTATDDSHTEQGEEEVQVLANRMSGWQKECGCYRAGLENIW